MRFLDTAVQVLTCANLLLTIATTGLRLRRERAAKRNKETGERE
jgi:hypothetical protein